MSATVLLLFAQIVLGGAAARAALDGPASDSLPNPLPADTVRPLPDNERAPFVTPSRREARRQAREEARRREAFNALPQEEKDSLFSAQVDSLVAQKADSPGAARPDSLAADTLRRDSVKTPRPAGAFLDDPITGKNTDSLVYDVRNKLVYIYNQGDGTRYRSLGCAPCTKPIQSESRNVHEIIEELRTGALSNIAERSGRAQDAEDGGGLETLRRGGYM